MPNLSLRDLDAATLSRIKSDARRRKLSVNRLIVDTLRQCYAPGQRAPDEVDALAGSWSRAQMAEFNSAIAPFGEIDAALWAAEPKAAYRVAPATASRIQLKPSRKHPAK